MSPTTNRAARFPIWIKLVAVIAPLIGVVVALFGLAAGYSQSRTYSDIAARERRRGTADARERGKTLARRLAAAVAPAIAENNFGMAKEVLVTTTKAERWALHVTAAGPDGTILVDSRPGRQGQRLDDPVGRRGGKVIARPVRVDGERAMLVSVPMRQSKTLVGELRVAYSLGFLESRLAEIARDSDQATRSLILRTLFVGGLCVSVGVLLAVLIAVSITKPIRHLVLTAERLSRGDLEARATVRSPDEIGRLGEVINQMAGRIRGLLEDEAEKVRLEKELEVARAVQKSLVPDDRPISLGHFDLAGFYRPATTCGGDWWDYFVIDGRLWVMVGDVSGHGVPSALITASAKSVCNTLRLLLGPQLTLETLMETLNHVIFAGGERRLGMSMVASTLELETGKLTVANGGHPMPYLVQCGGDAPKIKSLTARGARLGDRPQWKLRTKSYQVAPGDLLLWYTDGLIEGRDPSGREYGKQRLRENLTDRATLQVEALRDAIAAAADRFYAGHPQHDDISYVVGRLRSQ